MSAFDTIALRQQREAAAARAANTVPPLNPDFPWKAIAFAPETYGVEKDPPAPPLAAP